MSKIKPNAPCPCGSGKKYKKCCSQISGDKNATHYNTGGIDQKSNDALGLIEAGNFKEAEKVCKKLLSQYPNYIDGLERSAMLYEAKGDRGKAVEYYHKVAAFARKHDGFDPDLVDWALHKAEELK